MQEKKQPSFIMRYVILRYPYYLLAGIYYFTLHQIVLILVKIYGVIRRRIVFLRVKKITKSASEAFREDRNKEAIELFLKCINIIPELERYLYQDYKLAILSLGSLYRITGKLKEAEKYLNEAFSIIEENNIYRIELYIVQGDFYADRGELKKAEASYLKAYEKIADHKESDVYKSLCFNMHNLYMKMGQIDEAEKYLKES